MEIEEKRVHIISCATDSVSAETKRHVESIVGPVAWLEFNPVKSGGRLPQVETVFVDNSIAITHQEG